MSNKIEKILISPVSCLCLLWKSIPASILDSWFEFIESFLISKKNWDHLCDLFNEF